MTTIIALPPQPPLKNTTTPRPLGTGGLINHPRYHPTSPATRTGALSWEQAAHQFACSPPPVTVEEAGGNYSAMFPPFVPPLRGPFLSAVLPRSHPTRGSLVRTGREYSPPS